MGARLASPSSGRAPTARHRASGSTTPGGATRSPPIAGQKRGGEEDRRLSGGLRRTEVWELDDPCQLCRWQADHVGVASSGLLLPGLRECHEPIPPDGAGMALWLPCENTENRGWVFPPTPSGASRHLPARGQCRCFREIPLPMALIDGRRKAPPWRRSSGSLTAMRGPLGRPGRRFGGRLEA